MHYKPHILAHHKKGRERLQSCSIVAVLALHGFWWTGYNRKLYKLI